MHPIIFNHYDTPCFAELITVTKTGIVNTQQILVCPKHEQIIHGGKLIYQYYTKLKYNSGNTYIQEDIKIFNAVYYNGVQIVRRGKVSY